jgi:ATP-dependent DNA helicase RecG
MRYEHEQAETTIAAAEDLVADAEDASENIALRGEIAALRAVPGRSSRVEATLDDGTGTIRLIWFNASWIRNKLRPGLKIIAEGRAKRWKGCLQLTNPNWQLLQDDDEDETSTRKEQYRPVYSGSEELPSRRIQDALESVLETALGLVVDPLPLALRKHHALPELSNALRMAHHPKDPEEAAIARRRLAYDELLLMQLGVMMKRRHLRETLTAPKLGLTAEIEQRIRARFPFALTPDQDAACAEIAADLGSEVPMNRLLQGDVGAGKTAVALHAMLIAATHGHQAVLLAPTELLAEQHYRSITAMLENSEVKVDLLTGALTTAQRNILKEKIHRGECHLLVGTHALLSEDIAFHRLGLAVIDEQHRFGVKQRARLRRPDPHGVVPHVLVMTATPIPRTLSLTIYGDLDVTVIRHLPPGRQPVVSRVVEPINAHRVYEFFAKRIAAGEQGYVVVPAVEESDLGLKDVQSHRDTLASGPLHAARIEIVHGRLNRVEREEIMDRFRAGKIDVLVATIVIEVGVDVPNATMMAVEHAERFGLAQLHQLRGRVGRGHARSVCAFIGEATTEEGQQRLEAIAGTNDGFEIAELDLAIRGPGELFGARQSGMPPLLVADLVRDLDLLRLARHDARDWIDRDPRLQGEDAQEARNLIMSRYGPALGLGDVG